MLDMIDTFFFHSSAEAFLEATKSALVALVFVNHTILLEAACVHVTFANAASEEAFAAIAAICAIVFALIVDVLHFCFFELVFVYLLLCRRTRSNAWRTRRKLQPSCRRLYSR
jgi:hypothetical protein